MRPAVFLVPLLVGVFACHSDEQTPQKEFSSQAYSIELRDWAVEAAEHLELFLNRKPDSSGVTMYGRDVNSPAYLIREEFPQAADFFERLRADGYADTERILIYVPEVARQYVARIERSQKKGTIEFLIAQQGSNIFEETQFSPVLTDILIHEYAHQLYWRDADSRQALYNEGGAEFLEEYFTRMTTIALGAAPQYTLAECLPLVPKGVMWADAIRQNLSQRLGMNITPFVSLPTSEELQEAAMADVLEKFPELTVE